MDSTIDFEYVLRPVDDDRSESAMAEFEAARREFGSERDALFQSEEEVDNFRLYGPPFEGASAPEPPEWGKFISSCQNHLANKSKDLWLCVWLTEVLLAHEGFRGLADGITLIHAICDQHWDQVQPSPNGEDGVEYTVKLLSAVSKREAFMDAIRLAPITMESGQFMPASCATIDNIDGGERAALIGDTTDEFISEVYASIKKTIEQWQSLDDLLEGRCGEQKPPFAKVREVLNECLNGFVTTYPQVIVEDEPEQTGLSVTEPNEPAVASSGGQLVGDSHLKNREQAFKTLEALSRYFAENEPNSPVSAALKQAIRWGRMSFSDLLKDVVDDGDVREAILRLTGYRDSADEDGYDDD